MGICGVYPQSTYNDNVPQTRDECNSWRDNIKPSIGNDGRHCMCVKPNAEHDVDTKFAISSAEMDDAVASWDALQQIEDEEESSIRDVYELWQSDFEEGTYRIQRAGTYKIMEDIEFDFNAGDG